jgi:carbon-monoxide dehydrogenase small subunit
MEEHGLQCGFCTPGMMLTARALLDKNPHPDDTEIRQAISGQICRCTGYATIVRSVQWAAAHPAGPDTAVVDATGEPAAAHSAGTGLDGTDTAVPVVATETAETGTEVKA